VKRAELMKRLREIGESLSKKILKQARGER
jgi:hypothetical protein